jgi:uncharacterized membrane protein YdjX (TVP38/TMEM64 family)
MPSPRRAAGAGRWWRLAPLLLLLALVGLVLAFDLHELLSLETLERHRAVLIGLVDANWPLAASAFVAVYAVATALSVPGGLVLTVTGGFLFGSLWGTLLVVIGATAGAAGIFLIARTALGGPLRAKAGPWLERIGEGFEANAFSYLLVLRLIPLLPFFVVNLVPAFLGVRLGTYLLATFIGIIPATYVYATFGAGLGQVFAQGEDITLEGVLTPEIVIALVGLAVLALLPVIYKRWRGRTKGGDVLP